ncbi:UDP-N-acetylglucosamine--N-acetylmuramyl-(pentapeptide) pyrophosphoryl-undecaprenol N-acetylglucosamine transferase [Rickettsia endosymbiont of Cardiosporidium cionae]|uniref:UDP-N-acetylglucosamine--N-acetylmuramyl- (pentapeptide) pyrophosphoryl-undecaprenol N-acetylglucosamine transferase n=1 Tax=Rickettsia endosymbiont of Cardiosporidium cionae TaxID=2777155 RepID=UPI001894B1CB|nr:UDP-N-acetylglucosamine--N-acetylmuramyl-(pentapeptide) pyrophosphoryl-undecaprenol N-acetylglucosamine transferase [Rickettsia endosymbiont of Cardiosporidium cionae]KAF8818718.1 undecaprenyldiphospho-muramoylpentapeptide beta-N-acetylglucosaminyltransferase [Rickettsia endosymbiont of Cardiosporidium cionae]
MKRILLVAGGTGGHLFPAISLIEELLQHDIEIYLLTDHRCIKYLDQKLQQHNKIHIKVIRVLFNFSNFFKLLTTVAVNFIAFFKTLFFILHYRPNVTVGFGSYASFIALFISKYLAIPIVLYEFDAILGKANKFFESSAKMIGLAYTNVSNMSDQYKDRNFYVGHLVRNKIISLPKKANFDSKIFHILVLGGSQGASIFASLLPDTLLYLYSIDSSIQIEISQQVRNNREKEKLIKIYENLQIKYNIQEFFTDIYQIYSKPSVMLVISRAGASTIAELVTLGLPTIFIPLPTSTNSHQYHNASILSEQGASWCYNQEFVTPDILAKKIYELMCNRELLVSASKKLLSASYSQKEAFVSHIIEYMK